ncbi:hypothetical protein A3D25_00230 [Candidatus Daviesbacteria bacterium RIFCSPHIGHO2_02_FULL_43_12]|uniref:Uncharacterized protein n=1 Tax=Candidatus Daviesbacteria bacterium RIFCSPHIGHO2_02_FULL_43_12 TaxID=1797776 RepID=A0A1F5KHQ7_9BACT|nr:MAG: hypothetical protein A3E86_04540 [Candidatus Daviesbacteria bacterium RIFCSPHIGHO2_12_FULL_47_45]OGE40476.1 MAG: hypothetical protein A3D25_00230 [Candidatus Daviesbacteria bacterium RIFCSPHIGHO2_02_FULL_43_12]
MILIIIIFLGLILGLSFILGLRSMKDFQERPTEADYGAFLVQDPSHFTPNFIAQLHNLGLTKEIFQQTDPPIISFEHLTRGKQTALVLFAPKVLAAKLPLLRVELADYTTKIPVSFVNCFELGLNGKALPKDFDNKLFTQGLNLEEDEYLFLQIVSTPLGQASNFQVTMRMVVSAKDSIRRIAIARAAETNIKSITFLSRLPKKHSSSANFESYQKRGLLPGEVKKFVLDGEDIFNLIKV